MTVLPGVIISHSRGASREACCDADHKTFKRFSFFDIPADLCHRRRDLHRRWNHRLLHIHRLRGLEEDPDRQDVLITQTGLLFICGTMLSLFAKSHLKKTKEKTFLVEVFIYHYESTT